MTERLQPQYVYTNEAAVLKHGTYKYYDKDGKHYRQCHWKGNQWGWGHGSGPWYPYNLPALIRAVELGQDIWWTDGEKDADALKSEMGVCATSIADNMGAWKREYGQWFRDACVVIVADWDGGKGEQQARKLLRHLTPLARSIRVVRAYEGKDAFDHLMAGWGLSDFVPVDIDISPNGRRAGSGRAAAVRPRGKKGKLPDWQELLDRAIAGVAEGRGRNDTGMEFIHQLRDNKVPVKEAKAAVWKFYHAVASDDFPKSEIQELWRKHWNSPSREPWATSNGAESVRSVHHLRSYAEIEEEPLTWLWHPYIPDNKITLIDGDPGLGKSTLWIDIVSRVSSGDQMPMNNQPMEAPRNVLIMAGEDDPADTIKPRLRAGGADLSRVFNVTFRTDDAGTVPFSIPEDMPALEAAVAECQAGLVVLDPVAAYFSEKIQTGNDAQVRKAMTPLKELAASCHCAILCIRHLNKNSKEHKAIYRGGGSIAITGAARSVLLLAYADDENMEGGDLVMAVAKNNLVRREVQRSILCRVESWHENIQISKMFWKDWVDLSADRALSGRDGAPKKAAAMEFLKELLGGGMSYKSTDVMRLARDAGHTGPTLRAAFEALGGKASRAYGADNRISHWEWSL